MMKRIIAVTAICLALGSFQRIQADHGYKGMTEIGAQAGGIFFEGNSAYDEDGVVGGRIAHYLSDHWAIEGSVVGDDTEIKNTTFEADVLVPTGELQYHFGNSSFRPFFALGAGGLFLKPEDQAKTATLKDQDDFLGIWGLGLKWLLGNHFSARVDARHLVNADVGRAKNLATITGGLSLLFGGSNGEMPAAPAPKVVKTEDSDNDGIADNNDACPGTPAGVMVDSRGCAKDSDGDGVTDDKDACSGTAAGTQVDSRGCPVVIDADGDGVADDKDECPGTPAGTKVDASGCPETVKAIEDNWVLKGVNFVSGSDKLQDNSLGILNEAAEILKARSRVRVEVQGHTDNVGKAEFNLDLSQRRANSVKNYLVGKGVSADQIETKGYGQNEPVADNKTKEGRAQNRRIEFKVLSR